MPQVLNAHGTGWTGDTLPAGSLYVGRAVVGGWQGGVRFRMSKWRNPFTIGRRDGTREEVIAKYRAWLRSSPNCSQRCTSWPGSISSAGAAPTHVTPMSCSLSPML